MLTVVLALLAATGYSGADFSAGLAARRADVVRVTFVAELIYCVLLVAAVPFTSSQSPSLPALAWGAAAGASGAVAAMALYLGFRYAAFSVVSSVSAVGSAAFSVAAGLLLGERPGAASLAGIALALPAIAVVSINTDQPPPAAETTAPNQAAPASTTDPASTTSTVSTTDPASATYPTNAADPISNTNPVSTTDPTSTTDTVSTTDLASVAGRLPATGQHAAGVVCGVVAGGGFGLFFVGLNQAGSGSDLWPLASASAAGVLVIFCVAVAMRQVRPPTGGSLRLAVLSGVASAGGTYAFFLATHRGLLAITAVITSLYPAGTILLARLLLSERLTRIRIAGLCLAAVSISLIAAASAR